MEYFKNIFTNYFARLTLAGFFKYVITLGCALLFLRYVNKLL